MVLFSFVVLVIAPVGLAALYLWMIAADQYASTVGFSVRKEEVSSPLEILGGITQLSGSSSSDTDILYEYIQSQKMVSLVQEKLDLETLWSKPEWDPFFAYQPGGTIEDLVAYWGRMVKVYYDSGSGLIEIRVLAFEADGAQRIADAIFTESSDMINQLSAIARADAVRYANEELDQAVERLKQAREAITRFRNENRVVDPTADIETQAGILGTLQAQLAEALIDLDLLDETTRASDPRITRAERRVRVIEMRIDDERRKRGITGSGNDNQELFSTLVGEYERLIVDREFAEQTYTSSLAARDVAQAEARRKSRYLAAHIEPTRAERALYPQRAVLLGLLGLFLFMIWAIIVLVAYSLKDRR
ncbi:Capsule polysaccharide export inner-membrane protein [hydrothermal vent metagenome]|uniref:Capsule polysaccharide export inner-membrane protein n=1 Tax=hydrothermal vent metagenome TaxID=652676 RepID=A0A3B0SE40_9ZZZZ